MIDNFSSGKTRWWEEYYVRYFVGTIVGAAVIFSLWNWSVLHCEIQRIIPDPLSFDWSHVSVVVAIGLAYCYVAGAPILTFHAVRGELLLFEDSNSRSVVVTLFLICVLMVIFSVAAFMICLNSDFYSGSDIT